ESSGVRSEYLDQVRERHVVCEVAGGGRDIGAAILGAPENARLDESGPIRGIRVARSKIRRVSIETVGVTAKHPIVAAVVHYAVSTYGVGCVARGRPGVFVGQAVAGVAPLVKHAQSAAI